MRSEPDLRQFDNDCKTDGIPNINQTYRRPDTKEMSHSGQMWNAMSTE